MASDRSFADEERYQGYLDGGDPDNPEPSANRSNSYRHGFAVARSDRAGKPAFGSAGRARELSAIAEQMDTPTQGTPDGQ